MPAPRTAAESGGSHDGLIWGHEVLRINLVIDTVIPFHIWGTLSGSNRFHCGPPLPLLGVRVQALPLTSCIPMSPRALTCGNGNVCLGS